MNFLKLQLRQSRFASTAGKAGLYFRTLRHLRFSQLSGQVMMRVRGRLLDPAKILAEAPGGWEWSEIGGEVNVPAPALLQDPSELSHGVFTFINQKADLGTSVDWSASGMPRLWSYNLHYFDWIWALLGNEDEKSESGEVSKIGSLEVAKRLVLDWIENHPPSRSAGGWEPYPISLRLMNWSLLFGVRHRGSLESDPDFKVKLLGSIAKQAKWLEVNLETHIQANHLLENLVAFACVGSIFEGAAPKRLLRKYQPMLEAELAEQFLGDGLHYERSPMYHLRMLWLLEVLEATVSPVEVESLKLKLLKSKGREALAKLRHPDGEISLFNDAVTGIYPDAWKDEGAPCGAWSLPDAGYYGYRDDAGNYLAIDAGAVGPDYQPGHAHADYLSFELSLQGKRIITDTGIGTYDAGVRRTFDRSTAAHSTVEVAGENSAEVWGGFRVGRRVTPEVEQWTEDSGMYLKASHDGYRYLPTKAKHTRSFEWRDGALKVEDCVKVSADEQAIARFHFSPDCVVELSEGEAIIDHSGSRYRCLFDSTCDAKLVTQPSCSEFGVSRDRSVLELYFTLSRGENTWVTTIEPII